MRYLALILLLLCPAALLAQSQEDEDKGYIVSLIEDNLSGVSREVNIIGFEGALSSSASLDVLTVADGEGVWLTLEGVVLSWNRGALLRGQIDVEELSAERIIVARPPVSENTMPSPEAEPFSLPELPVGISLDTLNIAEIELGEAFLGEPIRVRLTGSAQLSGGEGNANIIAQRLGDKTGAFNIIGSYNNETAVLGLTLNLEEGPDGIAARMLDLPGRPSVRLAVQGTAPINDYDATIDIATDGADRINGTFGLTDTEAGRRIRLDVSGDVSPLLAPDYQEFFGDNVSLTAEGRQTTDGRIDISELELRAQRLTLSGALQIGAQGWPELIELNGGIATDDGAPVLLPLSGPRTFVDGAELSIDYDTNQSDDWIADISVTGFARPGLSINDLSLTGGGILQPGEGTATGRVTANLRYAATGLALDDAGAAQAFGDAVAGVFEASRTEGEPTRISRFTMTGPGLEGQAEATISGPKAGFQTQSNILLTVAALERFSTLAGQDLSGAAELSILASVTPLDGLFNVIVAGTTDDLSVGIPQADAALGGAGDIAINAVRDTEGTRLETLSVETDAISLSANAELTSEGSVAEFDARLTDIGLVLDDIAGLVTLVGTATQTGEGVTDFDISGTVPSANIALTGMINPAETGQTINADLTARVSNLATYAGVVDRRLAGAANLTLSGVLLSDGLRFDADLVADTRNLAVGIDRLDPLLAGDGNVSLGIARPASDSFRLSDLSITTAAVSITGDAAYRAEGPASADLDIRLPDVRVIDPSLSGPATLTLDAERGDDLVGQVALIANGPATNVQLDATVAPPAQGYEISGDLNAVVGNLRLYRALTGQPIAGAVNASISGSVLPDLTRFDLAANGRTDNLSIGNSTVDLLLQGTGRLNAKAALEDEVLTVSTLEATTRNVVIVAALNGNAGAGQGRFNATLRDVGIFTDQLSGPIRTSGTASLDPNGRWGVNASGTGPGGITLRTTGTVAPQGTLDLNLTGNAPLGLANAAIEPRRLSGTARFDVNVDGPAQLSSVNGRIDLEDGRLAAPTLAQALTNIRGGVTLANNTAQLGIQADVESGGGIALAGPIGLDAPNNAEVTLRLNGVVLKDPELYKTTVSGAVNVEGALQGGARVAGRLNVGETDVQIPSSSISALGELPDVIHIGEGPAVRRTLQRAGVNANGATEPESSGTERRPFPLDVTISAPARIFIRGRGLDAELGGSLNLGGTTANVIPVGRFDLLRGRIDILQQRFELTEGSASLQGDFEPYIRLVATTESTTGTSINIIVEGPASEPEVRFESTPELPQDEVLSQLIFGRDLDSISPLQAVQLASAISTLAGRGGGALDSLRENIGLDDFDVTTDEDGNAAVRAGKYLTDKIYTDVVINSEGDTEINLNLDITDEITAKGGVDQDGGTSVGIFFERDY